MNAKKEIEALRRDILRHERLYYVDAKPEISDYDFDQMMRRLQELEAEHPQYADPASPSHRVGGAPMEGDFVTVVHDPPMLSIDNAYSFDELRAWHERVLRGLGMPAVEYEAELKIDGVSIDLLYEAGLLTRAATRGDGVHGDDVTANVRTVRSLPLRLEGAPSRLEVRGEIYIARNDFTRMNQEKEEAGEAPLANPRNTAAGSLRQKDPRLVAQRHLRSFVYHVVAAEGRRVESQSEAYALLDGLGFPTNPGRGVFAGLDGVERFIEEWHERRHALDFEIDGIVVKVNGREQQGELGTTSKAPRWAIAYKYPPEAAKTVIREIRFQVGRTGTVTPVAEFDAVHIGGSTVRRATLHNFDEVSRKDVRVGDTVMVEKGGDVIPKVTEVLLAERPDGTVAIAPPESCPVCGQPLHRFEEEVAVRCINQGCPAIVREALIHFAGRKAMDIEGLGEKAVDLFVAEGLISDYSSLYELKVEAVEGLPRWGRTSAEKLVGQIDRSRSAELSRLIFALGIRFVGERAAKLLAERFRSIEALMSATTEELVAIPEIGPRVAESLTFWFSIPANRQRIARMLGLGLAPTFVAPVRGDRLAGKTVVVTGTLARYSRDAIHKLIEREGGKAGNSVSSKTSYLVAGEAAGSKLEKAKSLGVAVLTEDELLEMVGEG
jgi:DNA ligase (NAD+)